MISLFNFLLLDFFFFPSFIPNPSITQILTFFLTRTKSVNFYFKIYFILHKNENTNLPSARNEDLSYITVFR